MNFITNMVEFEAAQKQVIDYVMAGEDDDVERIEQLVTEMELYILRTTGHNTALHDMAQLPEEERKEAMQAFIKKNLNRTIN